MSLQMVGALLPQEVFVMGQVLIQQHPILLLQHQEQPVLLLPLFRDYCLQQPIMLGHLPQIALEQPMERRLALQHLLLFQPQPLLMEPDVELERFSLELLRQ